MRSSEVKNARPQFDLTPSQQATFASRFAAFRVELAGKGTGAGAKRGRTEESSAQVEQAAAADDADVTKDAATQCALPPIVIQMEDVVDMLSFLHPDYDMCYVFDHSSGHTKGRPTASMSPR